MKRPRRQPVDPLEAFYHALVTTRRTVEPTSSAAAKLDDMIATTWSLLHDADEQDQAREAIDQAIGRLYRSMSYA